MPLMTIPPPIPGEGIDPPPKPAPERIRSLDSRPGATGVVVGVAFRALNRFSHAKASLLAAGTTYYLFLAMFSILAFSYGLTASLGAERVAAYVTEAVAEAFPGLLGEDGIDPARLREVGQTMSVVGAVGLLYGGTGAVIAARRSLHLLYGAPKDPRNIVVARVQALGWLVAVGPLILLSFVASSVTAQLSDTILDALGVQWRGPSVALTIVSVLLTLVVNFGIVYLLIGNLGGIRPERGALRIAAAVGAFVIEILKLVMALLVSMTIDKPQYGAFAAPIGVLFVLYLQSMALYGAAALAAGVAERDVPLDVLMPADLEQAQDAVADAASAGDSGRRGRHATT